MKNTKYKQTEIGEIPEDWNIGELIDYVSINPVRKLVKQRVAKYIPMANLNPFEKNIRNYEIKNYNGGTKFSNGDTLLARITPCLENGKTAFVDILDHDEVGFGSTEYIVLTSKEKLSDKHFLYYLAISPRLRQIAIQSMVGSSGRQRVQTDKLEHSLFAFPTLEEQQQIASILSSLDDKIELNRKMNKTLEEIGKALFKRWFVDFEFPDENGEPYKSSGGEMVESELGEIPKGWEVKTLLEVAEIQKGLSYKGKDLSESSDTALVGLKCIGRGGGFRKDGFKFYDGVYKDEHVLKPGDLIVAMTDLTQAADVIGKLAIVPIIPQIETLVASLDLTIIKPNTEGFDEYYLYLLLSRQEAQDFLFGYTNGSTVLHLSIKGLNEFKLIVPEISILSEFQKILEPIRKKLKTLDVETSYLPLLRDLLLPRLMSGRIRVNAAK